MLSRENWGLAFALSAAALFSFAELLPSGLRPAALIPALELTFGAVVLALAGWAVAALCRLQVASRNFALQVGIGQIALLSWIYLRSMANAVAVQVAGIALPVTRMEVFLLIAGLAWLGRRKSGLPAFGSILPGLLWAAVAIFLLAQRELPREDMISSDPVQHAFFTAQILRLGVVPYELGMWGPADFGYPGGLAALCALWVWVGGGTPQNAVAGQPLLQSLLAILAIASVAAHLVSNLASKNDLRLQAVTGFSALLLFFGFFPFSLTKYVYLLEKTGSISTLLLLLTTLILTAVGASSVASPQRLAALVLAGAGVGLSAAVNPVAVIVPGVFYGCAIGKRLWEQRSATGKAIGLAALHGLAPFAVIFSDPYYVHRFLLPVTPAAAEPVAKPALPTLQLLPEAGRYALDFLLTLQWVKPFLQTPFFGRTPIAIVPLLVAFPVIWWLLPPMKRRPAFLLLALAPLPIVALEFTLLPLFHALRFKGDFYLLAPYFLDSLVRFGYLWYMAAIILGLTLILQRASTLKMGMTLFVLAAALVMVPVRSARDSLANEVRMVPRFDRCFYIGCTTDDDRVVLKALSQRFAAYADAGGSMEFAAIPKILLPNQQQRVFALWQLHPDSFVEIWYKPTGASAALPYSATFPAAFFFSKGSNEYSNANYEAHVCNTLDIPWLRERNIRFLFVPANRKGACVAGLDTLLEKGNIIVRSGEAALIQLF